ncbi:MAG: methyltransferase domain-containing protein [Acidobacteriota bacterium]|nr:methyltransferase domain-containing protein [Acidobacteriota bacterium]
MNAYVQQGQPPGVPPLQLTGERTLPDVPAENYWYQRHRAVYEWIAARVAGMRVVDMACGEGYGAATLASCAASVVGVDANPEAFTHARLRYSAPGLSFERAPVESYGRPGSCDAVTFLQTIEHVASPEDVLRHLHGLLAPGGLVYVSTPNLLTIAPKGADKSDNPWHVREYRAHEFRELCESVFDSVRMYGVYHSRRLRAHALALALGWDRVHRGLGLTGPFYDRFVPAISTSDFLVCERMPLYRALDFVAVCGCAGA